MYIVVEVWMCLDDALFVSWNLCTYSLDLHNELLLSFYWDYILPKPRRLSSVYNFGPDHLGYSYFIEENKTKNRDFDFHENSRIFCICKMTWRVFQFLKCPPFALPLFDPWDCWKYVCFSIAEFQAHSYLMAIWL